MKLEKKTFISIILFLFGVGVIYGMIKFEKTERVYEILEWDNLYNGNNIKLFYAENDKRLEVLNSTYKISELIENDKGERNVALKVIDIITSIVQYDDVEDNPYYNGYDILSKRNEGKKISGRDMAIIYRDLLLSIGYIARVGEFRYSTDFLGKDMSYYVVEYYSNEENKWIMMDVVDKGYFMNQGVPCSGIEVAAYGTKQLKYVGNKSKKEYLKDKKYIFNTYTIAIDNTLDMKKSNSFITFVSDIDDINIEHKNTIIPSTIYTTQVNLFLKSPKDEIVYDDKSINMVLMKKEGEDNKFIIAGFSNSAILENYYIRINDDEYRKIKKYTEIQPINGENIIEISLDGRNTLAEVRIKYNKR